ncbi:MAG: hypothetical protein JW703_04130 [Candidatus Diapherotrites archaeon]|nr:hypothetical protein [Candidatus Diapherotrites archaeon]
MVKGFFIQYKFILPPSTKHSAYSYQKLFRALYGYTQNVTKSTGKTHRYFREGVLTNVPYLRPGKNCVIIPKEHLNPLIEFFKTGKNPTHFWHKKGDWKAVYYMEEKNLSEKEIAASLEELLERYHVISGDIHSNLEKELTVLSTASGKEDSNYLKVIFEDAKNMISMPWFRETYKSSEKLVKFYSNFQNLKEKLGK